MLVFSVGREMMEHLNRSNCGTRAKMDDLWECLSEMYPRCPEQISYGPNRYCTHKDRLVFEHGTKPVAKIIGRLSAAELNLLEIEGPPIEMQKGGLL